MSPFAHASVSVFSRPVAPKAPFLVLVMATQALDILFFAFEALGLEQQAETEVSFNEGLVYLSPAVMYWSHGLVLSIVWSLLAAALVFLIWRDRPSSILAGLLVFSHWVLDFIVYPNMPLFFAGSPEVGLGLITSSTGFILGILLELALIGGAIAVYVIRRKRMASGRAAEWQRGKVA